MLANTKSDALNEISGDGEHCRGLSIRLVGDETSEPVQQGHVGSPTMSGTAASARGFIAAAS
ncbi:MAG TPA: hypothetical protein VD978_21010 [Azospirillum sp.]|nr:hypothetical protein [Azospirillum sp.]